MFTPRFTEMVALDQLRWQQKHRVFAVSCSCQNVFLVDEPNRMNLVTFIGADFPKCPHCQCFPIEAKQYMKEVGHQMISLLVAILIIVMSMVVLSYLHLV